MVKDVGDNQDRSIEEAVHEFLDAQSRGRRPDIDEFVKQYPGLEDDIRKRILNLRRIDTLFDSLVQADDADFGSTSSGQGLVGQTIGSFEIMEMIGRGGMGVVYLARDIRLERSVAIKSLPAGQRGDSNARTRFRREAKLLASLNHSNIAVIHEIIEQADGSGYLILEYVPGETLAERIAREPLTMDEALSIGQQIAEAVAAAHEKGVIHRDLKPGNIKITPEGKVKVLDFGLAKTAVGQESKSEITVTQPGHVIGTPAYMSPEQARGKSTSHYTDIWSFGCVLYEMLAGRRPFEGQTATDTLAQIIEREPDWQALPQNTPANIRVLLRRCLEKNPRRRLQHIADAELEIRETLNLPATAPPVTVPVKSRRMTMVVGAATIIVLAGVAVWYAFLRDARQIGIVVLPFDSLGPVEDELLAGGMSEGIRSHLLGIDRLRVICRTSAIQCKQANKTVRQIKTDLDVAYVLMGTVRWEPSPNEPARVHVTPELIKASDASVRWSDSYGGALTSSHFLGVQSKIAREVVRELGITLPDEQRRAIHARPTHSIEAWNCYVRGNDFELHGGQDKDNVIGMINMHGRAVELDPGFAEAYAKLSKAHSLMYWFEHDRSDDRRQKARQALESAMRLAPELPETLWAKGWYHYWCLDEYEIALELFERAQSGKPGDSQFIAATAYAQRRIGRFDEAVANLKEAYEADRLSRTITVSLGQTLMIVRRYEEAEHYLDLAIDLAAAFSVPYLEKAQLYLRWKGSTKEARDVLKRALQNVAPRNQKAIRYLLVDIDIYDKDYPSALDGLESIAEDANSVGVEKDLRYARICGYMENEELEEAHYQSARQSILKAKTQTPLWDRYTLSTLHSGLGLAYAGLGDYRQEAVSEGRQAVELMEEIKNKWAVLWRQADLARIYVMVGDLDSAIEIIKDLLQKTGELSLPLLEIDPAWAPLCEHPGYRKLLATGK